MRRACVLAVLALAACAGRRDPLPFYVGDEDPSVRLLGHGTLVCDDTPFRQLAAVDVPTGDRWTVRPIVAARAPCAHDGPDTRGNVAIIDRVTERTLGIFLLQTDFALTVVSSDGTQREVLRRHGDPLWDHAAGEQLAVASDGSRAAFVSDIRGYKRGWGPLEIWDLGDGTGGPTGFEAIGGSDGGVGWFPDGRRLAFGSLARRDDPRLTAVVGEDLAEFRDSLTVDGWVACVFVLDVDSHEIRLLHPGATPVVAEDGKSVLVHGGAPYPWFGDYDGARPWRRVDVATGASVPVSLPGDWQGVIALLYKDLVVYRGLPTQGSAIRDTESDSNFVGAKPMGTVKIADLATGRIATLLPFVDPRTHVSWGPFERFPPH